MYFCLSLRIPEVKVCGGQADDFAEYNAAEFFICLDQAETRKKKWGPEGPRKKDNQII